MNDISEQPANSQSVFLPMLCAILTALVLLPFLQALSNHFVKPISAAILGLPDDMKFVLGQYVTQSDSGEQIVTENAIAIAPIITEIFASAMMITLIYFGYRILRNRLPS